MPKLDQNVIAADTAINAEGHAPGIAQPTSIDEIKDIYISTKPKIERLDALQKLRQEIVARDSADSEGGFDHLLNEIDRGIAILTGNAYGSAGPDVLAKTQTSPAEDQ